MTASTSTDGFLKVLRERHGGEALVEIPRSHCEVRFNDGNATYLHLTIELSLGVPVDPVFQGFPVRNDALYRPEGRGNFTFEASRHGRLPWFEACDFVLSRALEMAKPGASSLLVFDQPSVRANQIRLILTGANDDLLSFRISCSDFLGDVVGCWTTQREPTRMDAKAAWA
jgi:hypothetical protein